MLSDLTQKHRIQLEEFDQYWKTEVIKRYNKASTTLLQKRQIDKYLIITERYEQSDSFQPELEQQKIIDMKIQLEKFNTDYNCARKRLMDKQDKEMEGLRERRQTYRTKTYLYLLHQQNVSEKRCNFIAFKNKNESSIPNRESSKDRNYPKSSYYESFATISRQEGFDIDPNLPQLNYDDESITSRANSRQTTFVTQRTVIPKHSTFFLNDKTQNPLYSLKKGPSKLSKSKPKKQNQRIILKTKNQTENDPVYVTHPNSEDEDQFIAPHPQNQDTKEVVFNDKPEDTEHQEEIDIETNENLDLETNKANSTTFSKFDVSDDSDVDQANIKEYEKDKINSTPEDQNPFEAPDNNVIQDTKVIPIFDKGIESTLIQNQSETEQSINNPVNQIDNVQNANDSMNRISNNPNIDVQANLALNSNEENKALGEHNDEENQKEIFTDSDSVDNQDQNGAEKMENIEHINTEANDDFDEFSDVEKDPLKSNENNNENSDDDFDRESGLEEQRQSHSNNYGLTGKLENHINTLLRDELEDNIETNINENPKPHQTEENASQAIEDNQVNKLNDSLEHQFDEIIQSHDANYEDTQKKYEDDFE